jgi:hypothetical protein
VGGPSLFQLKIRTIRKDTHLIFTVEEVAAQLRMSRDTVIRRFENEQGVFDVTSGGNNGKRRYRQLRIPKNVLDRFIAQRRVS